MRGLDGKRVIVTGGANGIGKATVYRLAQEGARVVLTDLDGATAEAAAAELREATGAQILPFVADVSIKADDVATVRFTLETLGGIDVLVNNAGIYYEDPFEEITEARWDAIMNVDLKGTFLMTQAAVPHFKAQRRAHRQSGIDQRAGRRAQLCALQRGQGRGRSAHQDAGARTGTVQHPRQLRLSRATSSPKARGDGQRRVRQRTTSSNKIPLRRTGKPEEVASVIAFLASDDASFVHGDAILIDGGQLAD